MSSVEGSEVKAHLLIGTNSNDSAFGVVAADPTVELVSDPRRLSQRAKERAFDLIVMDTAMAKVEGEIVTRAHESYVLVISGSQLLTAVRGAAARAPDSRGAAWEIIEQLFSSLRSPRGPGANRSPALPGDWIGTLVSRGRSSEEEASLRYRALSAAFADRKKLLEDSLSTQQVAALLGSSRQTPHDRVKSKTLLAIEDNGQLRFPPWQFDPNGPNGIVEGLSDVLRALALGPVAQVRWLMRKNTVLEGRTALDVLKAGEIQRVVQEARGVAAQAGSSG